MRPEARLCAAKGKRMQATSMAELLTAHISSAVAVPTTAIVSTTSRLDTQTPAGLHIVIVHRFTDPQNEYKTMTAHVMRIENAPSFLAETDHLTVHIFSLLG